MTARTTGASPAAAGKGREEAMLAALQAAERADKIHSKCEECMEYGQAAEVCEKCFPSADDARVMRRNVLAEIKKATRSRLQPAAASEAPISAEAVQSDYVLVPREPTEAMLAAACDVAEYEKEELGLLGGLRLVYRTMLSAAPTTTPQALVERASREDVDMINPTPPPGDVGELVERFWGLVVGAHERGNWGGAAIEKAKAISEMEAALTALAGERDEALDRIEQLELEADRVSDEFDKECWKIVRRLLDDIGFDWDEAGNEVTAEQAYEHISAALPIRDSEKEAT